MVSTDTCIADKPKLMVSFQFACAGNSRIANDVFEICQWRTEMNDTYIYK